MPLNPALLPALTAGGAIAAVPKPTHWLLTCAFSASTAVNAAVAFAEFSSPLPGTATARVPAAANTVRHARELRFGQPGSRRLLAQVRRPAS